MRRSDANSPPARSAGAPPASAHALQLQRGFPRLRFAEPLEAEFREVHLAEILLQVRRNLWLAIVFVVAFSALTHLVLDAPRQPPARPDSHRVFTPILLIGFAVVYSGLYHRLYPLVCQIGAPIFGIGVTVLAVIAAPHGVSLIATVVMVTIYIFFMLGMTFYAALGSSCWCSPRTSSAPPRSGCRLRAGDRRRRAGVHQRHRRDGVLHAGARNAHQLSRGATADRDREPRRPDGHSQPAALRRARRPHLAAGDPRPRRSACC